MSPTLGDFNEFYSCTYESIWTPEEQSNEKKRLCETCKKICGMEVVRIVSAQGMINFCDKRCYDKFYREKPEYVEIL